MLSNIVKTKSSVSIYSVIDKYVELSYDNWDDGEVSWEDLIYDDKKFEAPYCITNSTCRTINNDLIDIKVSTVKGKDGIQFDLSGKIKYIYTDVTQHSMLMMMKNPEKLVSNLEVFTNENPEFIVGFAALSAIIRYPPEENNKKRNYLIKLFNFVITFYTVLLKNPKLML
jgi:hypothetical protein